MEKSLYVVGQYRWDRKRKDWDLNWEIQGIFDSRKKALMVCKTPAYFIGKVILNKAFPDKRVKWHTEYPIKKW